MTQNVRSPVVGRHREWENDQMQDDSIMQHSVVQFPFYYGSLKTDQTYKKTAPDITVFFTIQRPNKIPNTCFRICKKLESIFCLEIPAPDALLSMAW